MALVDPSFHTSPDRLFYSSRLLFGMSCTLFTDDITDWQSAFTTSKGIMVKPLDKSRQVESLQLSIQWYEFYPLHRQITDWPSAFTTSKGVMVNPSNKSRQVESFHQSNQWHERIPPSIQVPTGCFILAEYSLV